MDLKSKVILIYGPTASGKSSFAIKLAVPVVFFLIQARDVMSPEPISSSIDIFIKLEIVLLIAFIIFNIEAN